MNKHVSKYLSAYVNQELDAASRRHVEEHLDSCLRCQLEMEQVRIGAGLASILSEPTPPVRVSIRFSPSPPSSARISRKYVWVAATCILVAFSIFGLSRLMLRTDHPATLPQVAAQPTSSGSLPPSTTLDEGRQNLPTRTSPKPAAMGAAENQEAWELTTLAGTPRVGSQAVQKAGKLAKGQWLETDNSSRAKLAVASIGFVDIGPNSRLRLVESSEREHRITLAKGKISAFILAPPRVFLVDTPSATAVDLGCAYTLDVDDSGTSTLRVTSGWVSFVLNGRESFVPAGASCITKSGAGVGTPVFEDASPAFQRKLAQIDFGKFAEPDIRELLIEARQRDSLTLWHLLARGFDLKARTQIFDFLEKSVPPPTGVTRDGILNADPKMLSLWWEQGIRQAN